MSLLTNQVLIPLKPTIPCIFPQSSFDYNFKFKSGEILKTHFDPYLLETNHRFFTATIEYLSLSGSGHMFINSNASCDVFPAINLDFNWNNTDYKLRNQNGSFVITNATIMHNTTANEKLGCDSIPSSPFLKKRDATANTPCPLQIKYASLGVAVDCSVAQQTPNKEAIIQEVLGMMAQTNIEYKKAFNIQLVLSVLDIRMSCSQNYATPDSQLVPNVEYDKWNIPCFTRYPIMNRLSDFATWRGARKDTVDVWHLYSTCSSDSKVGLAWPSSVCYQGTQIATGNYNYSGVSISTRQQSSWKVFAHEIGHNFGAIHDCLAPTCDNTCHACSPNCDCNSQFVMNPNQNVATNDFSPGTIQDVCNTLPSFNCLKSVNNISSFSENTCGNGIVEGNEECDCGDLCAQDKCCTSDCKLTTNSKCSDKNQACCNNCQYKPQNSICRMKESSCDVAEVCSGTNGNCPVDVFVPDGTSCSENGFNGNCASKYCTSANKQCTDLYPTSSGACSGLGTPDCILTCSTAGGCAEYQSFLIDGTVCGGGYGNCELGVCEYANGCNFNLCSQAISRFCGNLSVIFHCGWCCPWYNATLLRLWTYQEEKKK